MKDETFGALVIVFAFLIGIAVGIAAGKWIW